MDYTRQGIGMESASPFPHKLTAAPIERSSLSAISAQTDELIKRAQQLVSHCAGLNERLCGPTPERDTAGELAAVPNGVVDEIAQKLESLRLIISTADAHLERAHTVL